MVVIQAKPSSVSVSKPDILKIITGLKLVEVYFVPERFE